MFNGKTVDVNDIKPVLKNEDFFNHIRSNSFHNSNGLFFSQHVYRNPGLKDADVLEDEDVNENVSADIKQVVVHTKYEDQICNASDAVGQIGEQSFIQKVLLQQLAVENIFVSYLPDLLQENTNIFSEIISKIDVDPKKN